MYAKTVIGFCNQNGGKLVLGVADDGTVVGIPEKKVAGLIESLERMVYQASSPPILARVSSQRVGEKTLLVVEVSAGMNPPYFLTSKGLEKGTYIRLGNHTLRASPDIIEELKWRARGRYYDEMPLHHASENDLDRSKILQFIRACHQLESPFLRRISAPSAFSSPWTGRFGPALRLRNSSENRSPLGKKGILIDDRP